MEMPAVAANLTNEMLLLLLHMLYCCWSGWMDGWMDQSGGCPAQFLGLLLFFPLTSSSVESSFLLALQCSPQMSVRQIICRFVRWIHFERKILLADLIN
jgi:hypothetical protein